MAYTVVLPSKLSLKQQALVVPAGVIIAHCTAYFLRFKSMIAIRRSVEP